MAKNRSRFSFNTDSVKKKKQVIDEKTSVDLLLWDGQRAAVQCIAVSRNDLS